MPDESQTVPDATRKVTYRLRESTLTRLKELAEADGLTATAELDRLVRMAGVPDRSQTGAIQEPDASQTPETTRDHGETAALVAELREQVAYLKTESADLRSQLHEAHAIAQAATLARVRPSLVERVRAALGMGGKGGAE